MCIVYTNSQVYTVCSMLLPELVCVLCLCVRWCVASIHVDGREEEGTTTSCHILLDHCTGLLESTILDGEREQLCNTCEVPLTPI